MCHDPDPQLCHEVQKAFIYTRFVYVLHKDTCSKETNRTY